MKTMAAQWERHNALEEAVKYLTSFCFGKSQGIALFDQRVNQVEIDLAYISTELEEKKALLNDRLTKL